MFVSQQASYLTHSHPELYYTPVRSSCREPSAPTVTHVRLHVPPAHDHVLLNNKILTASLLQQERKQLYNLVYKFSRSFKYAVREAVLHCGDILRRDVFVKPQSVVSTKTKESNEHGGSERIWSLSVQAAAL